jgi:UV radiation resistance-associated gene protein
MVSTWFSLHCTGIDDPVYISEVIPKAMNPSFRFFDLNALGPLVTRLDEVTVKFWAKTEKSTEYTLLVELQVNLRSLQFIGKSLENFRHPLPPNSVIFHLKDGIYTSFTDLPPTEPTPSFSLSKPPKQGQEPQFTSSYDALMRLANLDDCIQDALSTREKLESQITSILSSNDASLSTISTAALAHEEQSTTKRAVATERKHLRATIKKREDLIASLASRRAAMAEGRSIQHRALSDLHSAKLKLTQSHALLATTHTDSSAQIARICEDLSTIYPIEPIPKKPLSFTIRTLHLPNSSSLSDTSTSPEEISAALGHVAQLVYSLSFYLSTPLPFPVKPFSSRSFIQDPIASTIPPNQRIYPLYPGVQFRFDYGVFLLNKDVEFLLGRQGLRILDPRHTLPNLKYLLYVLTAGTGELPARKAGGVRGLIVRRGTPSLSRQVSGESMVSVGSEAGAFVAEGNGKGKEKVGSPTRSPNRNTLPFRSSGLREVA